ncbi:MULTISPECIES: Rossmann-like and DUF2520 domain-containing protein [Maribacter]|uniref:DUF2520 domain-containing protein n=1 Tax=Maribacter flavus TaxID=1658664 RepID=A0ABU7IIM2_9FLAO|nr:MULTISPECIES: Rossmann-like and DUF2520 domain-containing protein [Maribacter]MDC6405440.1 DUF2520 domain-containing protein [Maribacter sp. PR66]MEE1972792.1 DUF2520 domain-containing protein [Maribacter flavus]
MISVVIIGTGNVAQNLASVLYGVPEIHLAGILGRSEASVSHFEGKVNVILDWMEIPKANIYIIAVKDDAIQEVSDALNVEGMVVHTSGSVGLDTLSKHQRRGVFYPLQTFTAGKIIDFKTVPMCLEVFNEKDMEILETLGRKISDNVQHIDSAQRKVLHVAAVFVNNFTNYMYTIGKQICNENDLDFSILYPLIKETAAKIETLSPEAAQTGPAIRSDLKTLHGHLTLLTDEKHRTLYKLISNAIKASNQNENEEKL